MSIPTICCILLLLCGLGLYGESGPILAASSEGGSTAAAALHLASTAKGAEPKSIPVYIGTYTGAKSKGIYLLHLDLATGELGPATLVADTVNPSFLAIRPDHRFLYAVNEVGNFAGQNSGAVSAFAIDPQTGKLTFLNQQPTGGSAPCHLIIDKSGKSVLIANYGGGSVCVLPIDSHGRLGQSTAFIQHQGSSVDPQRQEGPHAHCADLDAANHFAFVADLGLDKIMIYRFDAAHGTLVPNVNPAAQVAPGSGPRHFVIHPNGRTAYAINELNSTVTVFSYDAKAGALETLQTVSTLPKGFEGSNHPAEVQISPDGKFLYGSNRGHDSIVIYSIDPGTGKLTYIGNESTRGKNPRSFSIDPTGNYLLVANQDTDSVVEFRIDPQSGKLTPTGQIATVPTPVCVLMIPTT